MKGKTTLEGCVLTVSNVSNTDANVVYTKMMPRNVLILMFLVFVVLIKRCSSNGPSLNEFSSEIYLFEHQVTKADAKNAFKIYNESSFDGVYDRP